MANIRQDDHTRQFLCQHRSTLMNQAVSAAGYSYEQRRSMLFFNFLKPGSQQLLIWPDFTENEGFEAVYYRLSKFVSAHQIDTLQPPDRLQALTHIPGVCSGRNHLAHIDGIDYFDPDGMLQDLYEVLCLAIDLVLQGRFSEACDLDTSLFGFAALLECPDGSSENLNLEAISHHMHLYWLPMELWMSCAFAACYLSAGIHERPHNCTQFLKSSMKACPDCFHLYRCIEQWHPLLSDWSLVLPAMLKIIYDPDADASLQQVCSKYHEDFYLLDQQTEAGAFFEQLALHHMRSWSRLTIRLAKDHATHGRETRAASLILRIVHARELSAFQRRDLLQMLIPMILPGQNTRLLQDAASTLIQLDISLESILLALAYMPEGEDVQMQRWRMAQASRLNFDASGCWDGPSGDTIRLWMGDLNFIHMDGSEARLHRQSWMHFISSLFILLQDPADTEVWKDLPWLLDLCEDLQKEQKWMAPVAAAAGNWHRLYGWHETGEKSRIELLRSLQSVLLEQARDILGSRKVREYAWLAACTGALFYALFPMDHQAAQKWLQSVIRLAGRSRSFLTRLEGYKLTPHKDM